MSGATQTPLPVPVTPGVEVIKILGRANSFNVRKVLWACEELGLRYEREDWGRGFRSANSAEFLALNPAGQVPVVIDGSFVMRESNAIVRYLASKYSGHDFYPADLQDRQRIEQWMDWAAYDVTHALRGAFLGGQLQEAPWNNPWFVNQGRRDLIDLMALLSRHLETSGHYVTGDGFTIADIPTGLIVNRWFMLEGFEKPHYPRLAVYYDLLATRPAYLRHGKNGLP